MQKSSIPDMKEITPCQFNGYGNGYFKAEVELLKSQVRILTDKLNQVINQTS